ncbi:MAG: UDP-N-acetylmuramate--alanine ligase [Verrucomicrobia bacterium]|nr:UDP-N-acetylmuramate--alanine ligase [Verrucomicrobiota bacterium]MBT7066914.1 UDP-N-acetylmuramate--alanine ligase [Verrucomicrobiota bacterium]MBT7699120.1 UDP-N-acetylmuramate--alanine ligase [Verrucomicrobiota bacterium]
MHKAQHSHIVGVGGIGMSALAQVLLARGERVTGSDRSIDAGQTSGILNVLAAAGVELTPQDGSAITPATACVVRSTAIEPDNPDLLAAAAHGVPVRHRSDVLAACLAGKQVVAVTGTSGKSTVTAMIGWVMQALGLDPTVVNGAILPVWRSDRAVGNVRWGRSAWWVIEADESDRTLNAYAFDWSVVTNVSADHFGVDEARALFQRFAARARQGGVSAVDAPELLTGFEPELLDGASRFTHAGIRFHLPMPGYHNATNAWLSVLLMERMGMALSEVAVALERFPGLHRRLELVGTARGVRVFDDYAHNPAKITAAWHAVRRTGGRVLGVWRPHGYGPLRLLMEPLAAAFSELNAGPDELVVLPVYDVGGTADRSVCSEMLVERMQAAGSHTARVLSPADVPAWMASQARQGDTILIMGARDPDLPGLAARALAAL